MPGEPCLPDSASMRTIGSPVRPDDAASASLEKPALSLFPMSLTEALVEEANIELAWKNVKANRGAPGPDGITITEFPDWFRPCWSSIRQQLLEGTYQPQPVRRVTIDKPPWRQAIVRYPKSNRPFDPASHRTNPNSCVRSGFLGIELRVSTETLCSWSNQAGTPYHSSWLSLCRGHGSLQVL